jgi:hypothetical protein
MWASALLAATPTADDYGIQWDAILVAMIVTFPVLITAIVGAVFSIRSTRGLHERTERVETAVTTGNGKSLAQYVMDNEHRLLALGEKVDRIDERVETAVAWQDTHSEEDDANFAQARDAIARQDGRFDTLESMLAKLLAPKTRARKPKTPQS